MELQSAIALQVSLGPTQGAPQRDYAANSTARRIARQASVAKDLATGGHLSRRTYSALGQVKLMFRKDGAATEDEAHLMDTAAQPTRSGARFDAPYWTEAHTLRTLGARKVAHPATLQSTGLQKRQGYCMACFSARNRALAINSYPRNMERVVKRLRTPARTRGALRKRAPLSFRAGKVADLSQRG